MKQFLRLFAFIFLVFVLPVPAQKHKHPSAAQVNGDEVLQRQYDSDNATFFHNELPRISVKWADLPFEKDGEAVMGETGEDEKTHRAEYIRIDRETNITWGTVLLTLRHEECHVLVDPELPPNEERDEVIHGDNFQNCMIHLADIGALREAW